MPAMHVSQCQRFKYIDDEIIISHGDECDLTNIHRDGKWRWFWSSIRCECPCHVPAIKQKYVIEELPDAPRRVARHDA